MRANAGRVPSARRRAALAGSLAVVVALGLLSRRYPLPGVFAEYTGDALYAAAGYCAVGFSVPSCRPAPLAFVAFCLSAAVEVSQLLSFPWLRELRSTSAGALLLGQGFQWADLLAYGCGAVLAACVDRALQRRTARARQHF